MSEFTVFINACPINIALNDGEYRPIVDDLARCVGLPFLCTKDTFHKLLSYLSHEQYTEAVKWITYETDTLSSIARNRIQCFLLVSIACLVRFSVSNERIKDDLETFRGFISGLNYTYYTSEQILKMIVTEGLSIED